MVVRRGLSSASLLAPQQASAYLVVAMLGLLTADMELFRRPWFHGVCYDGVASSDLAGALARKSFGFANTKINENALP
ncbi:hypothetical protein A2U01_0026860 [Trifolium medium]|uniref:Uncharacterized protein n=1 Tax=Trifolium medium TaxID=97028 RepID=A0A392P1E0_9FABA|nr:hypothetical protein [Trifolium medium]